MPKLTSIRSRQPAPGQLASVLITPPIQDHRIMSAAASRSVAGRLGQSTGPPVLVLATRRASSRIAGSGASVVSRT
jgi:hypothetical protein